MNFPPFGSHFSPSIPSIHQFAAKLSQDASSNAFCNPQEDLIANNRYTANSIPSFTQHHHAAPHHLNAMSTKGNGDYLTSTNLYNHQSANLRRPSFEHETYDMFPNRPDKIPATNLDINKQKKEDTTLKMFQNVAPSQTVANHTSNPSNVFSNAWQTLTASRPSVVDYLSQLSPPPIPLSLHNILKYSAETLKKDVVNQPVVGIPPSNGNESDLNLLNNGAMNINSLNLGHNENSNLSTNNVNPLSNLPTINNAQLQGNNNMPATTTTTTATSTTNKKKKKKKPEKPKAPRHKPGVIRLSTALDGSTLYCCPECHMALPEREPLLQHLAGHNIERRFICDLCGSALKRKDHLTRHKQSHNPERPFECSICSKKFKRKEQLTLHFVIHSGQKKHICTECGKGFYRKDHLRKHAKSHINRKMKAEVSPPGTAPITVNPPT